MALYDKSVRELFIDMVKDFGVEPSEVLPREQVYGWFNDKYPKVKDATISAHLLKMSTNAPSRIHYGVRSDGGDDLLFQIDRRKFRLYDPATDPDPIYERAADAETVDDFQDEFQILGSEFAYESDLQNYLAKHLSIVEPGLRLYQEEGISGIEFPVGNRRIDILALDNNGNYVVIELKVSKGYDKVVGQLLRYMAWIQKYHAEPDQEVRGVIVAREISEDLLLACSQISNIDLYEYKLSIALTKAGGI